MVLVNDALPGGQRCGLRVRAGDALALLSRSAFALAPDAAAAARRSGDDRNALEREVALLWEDDHLAVVCKPQGLHSQGGTGAGNLRHAVAYLLSPSVRQTPHLVSHSLPPPQLQSQTPLPAAAGGARRFATAAPRAQAGPPHRRLDAGGEKRRRAARAERRAQGAARGEAVPLRVPRPPAGQRNRRRAAARGDGAHEVGRSGAQPAGRAAAAHTGGRVPCHGCAAAPRRCAAAQARRSDAAPR